MLFSSGLKAESMSKLFESTQVIEEVPVVKKKVKKSKPKRKIASKPKVFTTYVYSSDHSFEKQMQDESKSRQPASLAFKGRVIGVRRELALSSRAAGQVPQEFVINTGSRLGIAKGSKLKVFRTMPIVDPYDSNKQYEIKVDFAILKVTHVEDNISLAKLEKVHDAKNNPYVGTRGVLVGDYVSNY